MSSSLNHKWSLIKGTKRAKVPTLRHFRSPFLRPLLLVALMIVSLLSKDEPYVWQDLHLQSCPVLYIDRNFHVWYTKSRIDLEYMKQQVWSMQCLIKSFFKLLSWPDQLKNFQILEDAPEPLFSIVIWSKGVRCSVSQKTKTEKLRSGQIIGFGIYGIIGMEFEYLRRISLAKSFEREPFFWAVETCFSFGGFRMQLVNALLSFKFISRNHLNWCDRVGLSKATILRVEFSEGWITP